MDPTRNEEEPTPPPRRTPPTKTDCEQGYAGVDCDECAEGYSMLNGVCTKLPEVGCYTPGTHSVTRSNCNCKVFYYSRISIKLFLHLCIYKENFSKVENVIISLKQEFGFCCFLDLKTTENTKLFFNFFNKTILVL